MNVTILDDYQIPCARSHASPNSLITKSRSGMNHVQDLDVLVERLKETEALVLIRELGKNEIKVLGRPTDEPSGSSCYRSRFCGVV